MLHFTWLPCQRSVGRINALLEHLYGLFCVLLSFSEAFESDFFPGFHSQV